MSEDPSGDGPVLAVEKLRHAFGEVAVLSDVSFAIAPGDVVCLVGPNGSGKTTLLRHVSGLLTPDDGSIDVAARGGRTIGYLPQRPAFRPGFSVRETLSFYASLVPTDHDVETLVERVGLTGAADRDVAALSGGMTRLLGIAQTVIGDPSLLVLDEPASGLDPRMTHRVTDAIETVADRGDAVLLATHNLAAVERIADKVLVLDRGSIVAEASPTALMASTETTSLDAAFEALTAAADGGSS